MERQPTGSKNVFHKYLISDMYMENTFKKKSSVIKTHNLILMWTNDLKKLFSKEVFWSVST